MGCATNFEEEFPEEAFSVDNVHRLSNFFAAQPGGVIFGPEFEYHPEILSSFRANVVFLSVTVPRDYFLHSSNCTIYQYDRAVPSLHMAGFHAMKFDLSVSA
ncbi:unnamed protein product [Toxocara canis]|uniref:CN hydrolase domain-containing protein n=1 Tax=Toxocara canis TaxID=6265 RepID=A0A183V3N0_TOXCA|nr:unnamed protein product [Toxocara canis]